MNKLGVWKGKRYRGYIYKNYGLSISWINGFGILLEKRTAPFKDEWKTVFKLGKLA